MTTDIWQTSDALDPIRLSVLAVGSLMSMVAWLIIDHELWERPTDPAARDKATLFNIATSLTVALGVLCLYVVLLAVTLLVGAVADRSGLKSDEAGPRGGLRLPPQEPPGAVRCIPGAAVALSFPW